MTPIGAHDPSKSSAETGRRPDFLSTTLQECQRQRSETATQGYKTMNWDEVKSTVETHGNIWTGSMEMLRDAAGKGRLGIHVNQMISRTLAGMGLGHVPVELPSSQHEQVRLYKKGTPIGILIDQILVPGEKNDELLRQSVDESKDEYAMIVQKIRELVAD